MRTMKPWICGERREGTASWPTREEKVGPRGVCIPSSCRLSPLHTVKQITMVSPHSVPDLSLTGDDTGWNLLLQAVFGDTHRLWQLSLYIPFEWP